MKQKLYGRILIPILFFLLGTGVGFSQVGSFQSVIGGDDCRDAGKRGVMRITDCGGSSYPSERFITIGETFSTTGCNTSDVLFTMLNQQGRLAIGRTYDIGGNDTAFDIEPIISPSGITGFVITGVTDMPNNRCESNRDIFLLKIDCMGEVVWLYTYGTSDSEEVAYEVIQATTGDGVTTFAGDYIIAGWTRGAGAGQRDGYLLRVSSNGATIRWDKTYGGEGDDFFYAAKEAVIIAPAVTGDVFAVGGSNSWTAGGDYDGYAVRANGNTGTFTTAEHGAGIHGNGTTNSLDPVDDIFRAVEQITLTACAQDDMLMAGYTLNNQSTNAEIYLVQIKGHPANYKYDEYIGDYDDGWDEVFDLQELTTGSLIMTGRSDFDTSGFGGDDVFLTEIIPAIAGGVSCTGAYSGLGLAPGGIGYILFGGANNDWGWSVNQVPATAGGNPAGFIVCGFEKSNLAGITPADPEDKYVIRTSANGLAACNTTTVTAYQGHPRLKRDTVEPLLDEIGIVCSATTDSVHHKWVVRLCGIAPKINIDHQEEVFSVLEPEQCIIFPNPVTVGTEIQLQHNGKFVGELTVKVTGSDGKEIIEYNHYTPKNELILPISTKGWPAGIYIITILNGGHAYSSKIAVGE